MQTELPIGRGSLLVRQWFLVGKMTRCPSLAAPGGDCDAKFQCATGCAPSVAACDPGTLQCMSSAWGDNTACGVGSSSIGTSFLSCKPPRSYGPVPRWGPRKPSWSRSTRHIDGAETMALLDRNRFADRADRLMNQTLNATLRHALTTTGQQEHGDHHPRRRCSSLRCCHCSDKFFPQFAGVFNRWEPGLKRRCAVLFRIAVKQLPSR